MGGPATVEGATYQEGVIAYVFVHALAMRRLAWIEGADDTPIAVSGETGGPGDDVRVESAALTFELQAKAGLTGEAALTTAVREIVARMTGAPEAVILAVDRRSSTWIYNGFASDLDRIRDERTDFLARARPLYEEVGYALKPIRVKALDVLPPDQAQADLAVDMLARLLGSDARAAAAWSHLLAIAADVSRRRRRKNRAALVDALRLLDIEVPPIGPDGQRLNELEFIKQLLERRHAAAALAALSDLERRLPPGGVGSEVRYWLWKHRATALIQLERFADAKASVARALDIKPAGVEALSVAGIACLRLGDIQEARSFADQAIQAVPTDPKAWGVLAQVRATAGEGLAEPPGVVAETTHYRTVLAEIAVVGGEWERALDLTGQVLGAGERPPEVLFLRAAALQESMREPGTRRIIPSDDVERLTTEAIDGFDDVHPLKARALLVRAANRQEAGRTLDAESDLVGAADLARNDPDVTRNAAASKLARGDAAGALRILLVPACDQDPFLLAVRAQVRIQLGDSAEAGRDLDAAIARLGDAEDGDSSRLAAADPAIDLVRLDVARELLDGLTGAGQDLPIRWVLEGRIALIERRYDDAAGHYRRAAGLSGAMARECLTELATGLVGAGEDARALDVFSEVEGAPLPAEPLQAKVRALMRIRDLEGAQREVDALAAGGPLPAWALGTAIDIALEREDPAAAITHLSQLVERGNATPRVRLILARELLQAGLVEPAVAQVDALREDMSLAGEERMGLAGLLRDLGRGAEAVQQGFRAFREARDMPDMHRALVGLVFASRIDIPPPALVGPDTHVRLVGDHDEAREYTILAEPPFDVGHNELSVEQATELDVLGKAVDDEIIQNPESTWQRRRWVVAEIVPAVVHFAQDALAHFDQRFGNQPFLATAVHVGDGSEPADWTGVIQALVERREHVQRAFALHRDQGMPLGLVAEQVGASVPDLMEAAATVSDAFGDLLVEWDDPNLFRWSVEQARAASIAVLTRSAVRTIHVLGLADAVREAFDVVAPRSLLDDLRGEVTRCRDEAEHGRATVWSSGAGIGMEDVEAGAPILRSRLEAVEGELAWATDSIRVLPRPFHFVAGGSDAGSDLRGIIGRSSFDALALASATDMAALYADDLGLRRVSLEEGRVRSFSSVSLILWLAEAGHLTGAERDRHLLALCRRGYVHTPASVPLLLAALSASPQLAPAELRRVFRALGNSLLAPADSARVVGGLLRDVCLVSIRRTSPSQVLHLCLPAMSARMPRRVAASLVEAAAAESLLLLPSDLDEARTVCRRFAAG